MREFSVYIIYYVSYLNNIKGYILFGLIPSYFRSSAESATWWRWWLWWLRPWWPPPPISECTSTFSPRASFSRRLMHFFESLWRATGHERVNSWNTQWDNLRLDELHFGVAVVGAAALVSLADFCRAIRTSAMHLSATSLAACFCHSVWLSSFRT